VRAAARAGSVQQRTYVEEKTSQRPRRTTAERADECVAPTCDARCERMHVNAERTK
jgi:hypothetical protein